MGKAKKQSIEQREAITVDWDSAVDDDVDSDDPNLSSQLFLRDGMARLDLDRPPISHDVGPARSALAMHWRMPAEKIQSFTLRSLRSSSTAPKRPEYTVHFIDESRWPELVVESDAQAILVDLIWRVGGDKGLARMVRASPFLAIKAPVADQDTKQKNMAKVLKGMHMTFSWGMYDHLMSFLAKESLKNGIDTEDEDDPDFIRWHRPFHPHGVDVLDIYEALDGCNIPDGDLAAKRVPAEDTLTKPPLSQLQHRLYLDEDVKKAKRCASESGSAEHSRRIGNLYDRMLEVGGVRPLAPAPEVSEVLALADAFPNFGPVVFYIAEQIALARLHDGPAHFSPVLLAGPPGIGKTQFATELSKTINTTFASVSFSAMTGAFVLSGSAALWHGSKYGKIFETLHNGTGNPIVMLDEVDKVGGDQRYDPLGPIYQLLEPATAKAFEDEYVSLPIDASMIMWVATANDLERIPKPILSRFTTFHVPAPTPDQVLKIAERIYAQMLMEPFGSFFEPELSSAVLDTLGTRSPRELRLLLRRALGKAAIGSRRSITVADLVSETNEQPRRSIGFCCA